MINMKPANRNQKMAFRSMSLLMELMNPDLTMSVSTLQPMIKPTTLCSIPVAISKFPVFFEKLMIVYLIVGYFVSHRGLSLLKIPHERMLVNQ